MSQKEIIVPLLLGTGRPDRQSAKVAETVRACAAKRGWRVDLYDAGVLTSRVTHGPWQPASETEPWRQAAAAADGFIIVMPEYNHGYPGELKTVWDSAYSEYRRKPVMLCGVSNGGFGGARGVENFLPVAVGVHAVPLCGATYFSQVDRLFDADGRLLDSAFTERLEKALDEFQWFLETLKTGRAAG